MDVKEKYRRDLKSAVGAQIDELIDSGAVTDFSEPARNRTVSTVVDALAENLRLNDRLGPFYTTAKVAEVLGGITRQAVSERARNHRLLRVITSDGVPVYPSFQFDVQNGTVRRELIPLMKRLLGTGVDPWVVAYWLTSELPEFGRRTVADVAGDGPEALKVLGAMAEEDAGRWASAGYDQQQAS